MAILKPLKSGDIVPNTNGLKIYCALSDAPIHFGTHKGIGIYDVAGSNCLKHYNSLDDAAHQINKSHPTWIVAIRKIGDRNITNDHLHCIDTAFSPYNKNTAAEEKRLRNQGWKTGKELLG